MKAIEAAQQRLFSSDAELVQLVGFVLQKKVLFQMPWNFVVVYIYMSPLDYMYTQFICSLIPASLLNVPAQLTYTYI